MLKIGRLGSLMIVGTLGTGSLAIANETDPTLPKRLQRSLKFWSRLFPIYLHYRYLQWKIQDWPDTQKSKEYEKLHEKYAPQVLNLILSLRGIYVKIGQVGVTREDILPRRYREEFKILLDSVPAISGDQAVDLVENALGKSIVDVFDDFESEPIGAASIGQVHRAIWKETGEKVIVKVKYPDSFELLQSDMQTMKQFVSLAEPSQAIAMDELERQFLKEFDFEAEGEALKRTKRNIQGKFPKVVIPSLVYANKNIVVMEYLPGVKLIDAIMDEYAKIAKNMGISTDELFELGKTMPKPTHFDRILQRSWHMVHAVYQHTVRTSQCSAVAIYNSTFGWIFPPVSYPKRQPPPINPPALFDEVVSVHGHQIFIDGFFNGDPHPGNILLLEDGRIGLIDYGQVKELTQTQRLLLAEFLVAIAKDDKDEIVEKMFQLGFESEKKDREVAYLTAKLAFDRDDQEALGGLNFREALESLDKRDRTTKIPEHYVMVVRVCLLMRGLGVLLKQPPISMAQVWLPFAQKALKDNDQMSK